MARHSALPTLALALLLSAAAQAAPAKPKCKKHIVATFAVYHYVERNDLVTNGCWTPEYTVQEKEKFHICHATDAGGGGKKPVAVYDDVSARWHPHETGKIAACSKQGAEFWEYLTPPFVPITKGVANLKRVYAELYNSTSGPAAFTAQWQRNKRIAGHTIWPMIDLSPRHFGNAGMQKFVRDFCKAHVHDHGVLGLYSDKDISKANGALPALVAALNACTAG